MMTPRETIRMALLFTGIVLLSSGAIVGCAKDDDGQDPNATRLRVGKGGPPASAVPNEVAPWLLAGGTISLFGAFLVRDR
jgi:hypothetical protein